MRPDRPEHEPEPELRRAFDAWQPAPARASFRAELHELFMEVGSTSVDEAVSSGAVSSGIGGASGIAVAPALAAALDAYAPQARTEFRDRLRAEFVSGTVSAQASTAGSSVGSGVGSAIGGGPVAAPRVAQAERGRWRLLLGGAGGLLAAAAALMLWVLQPLDPSWSIDPGGYVAEGLTIDGRALSANTPLSEAIELLSTAAEVSTTNHALRLVLGELFVVELAESSTLDLSRMPADLSRGDLVLHGLEGGFRVATGPEFQGSQRKLRFETDDVDVEVVGTVFGVDLFPSFTCICCLEGEVATHLKTEPATFGAVGADSTSIVHKDGEPVTETRYEPHLVRLAAISDFWER
ncbi:MAG: hypothetical protein V3T22_11665 [Planctomycetota bacterium]